MQEQLDGAGIELPSLYKLIEKEAPNVCSTEAWKKRNHWVGSVATSEIAESIADAEKHLQVNRPVRRYGFYLVLYLETMKYVLLQVLGVGSGDMVNYWKRVLVAFSRKNFVMKPRSQ